MALFSALAATAATAGATAGASGTATGLAGAAGALGSVVGLAGTGLQIAGQLQANAEARKQADLQKAQMNLEASRQRRQVIRQALIARSDALSTATNQGAAEGSGLAGSLGQIATERGESLSAVNSATNIGNAMFDSKAREASAQTLTSIGSGINSLGGALVKDQQQIGRLGAYYTA